MSTIELIDSENFNVVEKTAYNVLTLAAEIDTKNHLIAQTILNYQTQAQAAVQAIQNDITALQSDIDAAVAAGATAPTPSAVDISGLVTSVATLATQASALA